LELSNLADGSVKNIVEYEIGTQVTGSTTLPDDNTIPQITEGTAAFSLGIVPTNIHNKIKVHVVVHASTTAVGNGIGMVAALFNTDLHSTNAQRTSRANTGDNSSVTPSWVLVITDNFKATVVTFSTFSVRFGSSSNTVYLNSYGSNAYMGGVMASSIMIEEVESQLT